jgi:signal transduction histidine kinase
MNKKIFCCFLILYTAAITFSAFSEAKFSNTLVDSLRKELIKKKGSDRIAIQLDLAMQIMENEKHEAQMLADSALKASLALKSKNMEMRSYLVLGRINELLNKKDLSDNYYDSALPIAETLGDNWYKGEILFRKGVITNSRSEEIKALEYFNASLQAGRISGNFRVMGSAYSAMGTIFRVNGLYDRAIEYIINAKLNYEKAGFPEGNAWGSYILGRIYSDLKQQKKAMEHFQEALKFYLKQASQDGNNNGIAICYEQIGLLNIESGNFGEAHKYIENSLKIYSDDKSAYGISNSYKNFGIVEYSMGNYSAAEKYLNESLKIKNEIGDILSLPTIYEYLGLCLVGKGQTDAGLKSLKSGLKLAISNNQKKIQLNIYSKLTEVYLGINDLKNAIDCQKQQIEIQDLILSGAANIKIEQLQAIYEIDKKNGQILELEKQNEINSLLIKQHRTSQFLMIAGIIIAFLISLSIYWFYTKIRHKNLQLKETNAAKDKLFAIVAHDLRGPTGNLTAFLEHLNDTFDDYRPNEIKELLITLSKSANDVNVLLENLLKWAQSQLNKIEYRPTELNLTDMIQNSTRGLKQTADNKQVEIKFELNDKIFVLADQNMIQTIVRNLLSNAIKFSHRGGSVIIKTTINDGNNANISIIDFGVGIEKSSLVKIFDISNSIGKPGTENEKSTGLGLILVKDFIEKNKGTITIDSQIGSGTTVSFTLPIIQGM